MSDGTIFGREPGLILETVKAIVALAVAFGLNWTGQQVAMFIVVVGYVLQLIARSKTTPTASPTLPIGTPVTTPDGAKAVVSGAAGSQP